MTAAVERYLDDLDERWDDDTVTIVIPEFVTGRLLSPTQLLHNQSAAARKLALLFRKGTVVTSVPCTSPSPRTRHAGWRKTG